MRSFEQGTSAVLLLSSCLSRLTRLRYLDLSNILLNDTLIGVLASHVGGTLEHLSLAHNPLVTDEGVAHVVLHCQHLQSCDLTACDGVTASGVLLLMHPGALMGHALNLVKRMMVRINVADIGVGSGAGLGGPDGMGGFSATDGSPGGSNPGDLMGASEFMTMDAAVHDALRTQVLCAVFGTPYVDVSVKLLRNALRDGLVGDESSSSTSAATTSTVQPDEDSIHNIVRAALVRPTLLTAIGRAYRRASWLDTGHPGAVGPCLVSIMGGKMLLGPGNNSDLAALSARLLSAPPSTAAEGPSSRHGASGDSATAAQHPAASAAAAAASGAAGVGLDRQLAGWSLMGWRHDDPALGDIRIVTGDAGLTLLSQGGHEGGGAPGGLPQMSGTLLVGIGFDAPSDGAHSALVTAPGARDLAASDSRDLAVTRSVADLERSDSMTSEGTVEEGVLPPSGTIVTTHSPMGALRPGSQALDGDMHGRAPPSEAALLTGMGGAGGGLQPGMPPTTVTTAVQVRLPVRGPLLCTVPMGSWPWSVEGQGTQGATHNATQAPPPGHEQPVTVVVPLPFPVRLLTEAQAATMSGAGSAEPPSPLASVASSTTLQGTIPAGGAGGSHGDDAPTAGSIPHYTLPGLLPLPWNDSPNVSGGDTQVASAADGSAAGGGKRRRRGGRKKKADAGEEAADAAAADAKKQGGGSDTPSSQPDGGAGGGKKRRRKKKSASADDEGTTAAASGDTTVQGGAGGARAASAAGMPYNPLWGLQSALPPPLTGDAARMDAEEVQAAALGRAIGEAMSGRLGQGVDFTLGLGLGGIESPSHYNLVSHQQRLILYGELLSKQEAYISDAQAKRSAGMGGKGEHGSAGASGSHSDPWVASALGRNHDHDDGIGHASAVAPYIPAGGGPGGGSSSAGDMKGGVSRGMGGMLGGGSNHPQHTIVPSTSGGRIAGGYSTFAYAYAAYLGGYAAAGTLSNPPSRSEQGGRPQPRGPPTVARPPALPLARVFAGQLLLDSGSGASGPGSMRSLTAALGARGGQGGGIASTLNSLATSGGLGGSAADMFGAGGMGAAMRGGSVDPLILDGLAGAGGVQRTHSIGSAGGDSTPTSEGSSSPMFSPAGVSNAISPMGGGALAQGAAPGTGPGGVFSVSPFELAITASRALMDVQTSAARAGALGVSMMNIVAAGLAPVLRSHMSRGGAGGLQGDTSASLAAMSQMMGQATSMGGGMLGGEGGRMTPAPLRVQGGGVGKAVAPAATPGQVQAAAPPQPGSTGDDAGVLTRLRPTGTLPSASLPKHGVVSTGLSGGAGPSMAPPSASGQQDDSSAESLAPEPFEITPAGGSGAEGSSEAAHPACSVLGRMDAVTENSVVVAASAAAINMALSTPPADEVRFEGGFDFGGLVGPDGVVMTAAGAAVASAATVLEARSLWMAAGAGDGGDASRPNSADSPDVGRIAPLASSLPVPLPRLMGYGLGAVGGPLKRIACPPLTTGEATLIQRVAGFDGKRAPPSPGAVGVVHVTCCDILTADGYELSSSNVTARDLADASQPGTALSISDEIGLAFLPLSVDEHGMPHPPSAVRVLSNAAFQSDAPYRLSDLLQQG